MHMFLIVSLHSAIVKVLESFLKKDIYLSVVQAVDMMATDDLITQRVGSREIKTMALVKVSRSILFPKLKYFVFCCLWKISYAPKYRVIQIV